MELIENVDSIPYGTLPVVEGEVGNAYSPQSLKNLFDPVISYPPQMPKRETLTNSSPAAPTALFSAHELWPPKRLSNFR